MLQHGLQSPLLPPPQTLLPITAGPEPHLVSTADDLIPAISTDFSSSTQAARSASEDLHTLTSTSEHQLVTDHIIDEETVPPISINGVSPSLNVSTDTCQMKAAKTKVTIGILSTLISYISLNSLAHALNPKAFIWCSEDKEDGEWISTSNSWLDRKACRWLGLCGVAHIHAEGRRFGSRVQRSPESPPISPDNGEWQSAWLDGHDRPEDWTDDEIVLRTIPEYVLEHAPLVHLYSEEQFWPCDIAEHLYHITPTLNYTPLPSKWQRPNLGELDRLNEWQRGRHIFLTSEDDVEERPAWLEGKRNIPADPVEGDGLDDEESLLHYPGRTASEVLHESVDGLKEWYHSGHDQPEDEYAKFEDEWLKTKPAHDHLKRAIQEPTTMKRLRGGRSTAPAVLVTVNKGNGIVDAFWFFFYSFNLGNTVFNVRFGNHVGDWEHSMVRFHHGKPKAVFFSEHNFGSAYGYDAVEKIGKRPVIYSAKGTHAMYSTPGLQPYVLPWGILHDITDRGPLWDPLLNSHSYTYDYKNGTLRSSNLSPEAPTNWFHYAGHWGDKFYPLGDKRQYRIAGQYHYVNGPIGPKFKNLGRKKVCGGPDSAPCVIKHWLGVTNKVQRWHSVGQGDDLSEEDLQGVIIRDPK